MIEVVYTQKKIGNGKKKDIKRNGYIGMNDAAYKSIFRKKYPLPKNVVVIYNNLPKGQKKETIRHEVIEKKLMEQGKFSYKKAHKVANILEDDKDIVVRVRASSRAKGYERRI